MTTIYNALRNNFSQVSNSVLLDVRLSSKAKTLYWYMCYRLGLSEKWEFHENEILKHFKEKRDAMREAKNELIEAGYLVKIQTRNDKGFFQQNDYRIFAEPQTVESDPSPENPSTDKPSSGKPSTEKTSLNNKEEINKEENNKKSSSFIPLEEAKKIAEEEDLSKKIDVEFWWRFSKANHELKPIKNPRAAMIAYANDPKNQLTSKTEITGSGFKINRLTMIKGELMRLVLTNPADFEKDVGILKETQEGFELLPSKIFDVEKYKTFLTENKIEVK